MPGPRYSRRIRRCAVTAAALLPCCVAAQEPAATRALRLTVDNDLIALRGAGVPPDYDYTHGMRLAAAWDGAPRGLRRLARRPARCRSPGGRDRGCLVTAVEVGQEIYTPRRDAPTPVPGERPYAGWLYASAAARGVTPGHVRTLRATAGVTGAASLAEQVQDGVHRLLHNAPQLGWAHQLGTAPGVALSYDEAHRLGALRGYWGVTAGTVRVAASAGAELTVGLGAQRAWSPLEPEMERPRRAFVVVGYRQDWVGRDVLIEGRRSDRAAGAGARRRPLVGQAELGAGYRWRSLSLEYRHAVRGREYDAQPGGHAVGSLRVTVHGY